MPTAVHPKLTFYDLGGAGAPRIGSTGADEVISLDVTKRINAPDDNVAVFWGSMVKTVLDRLSRSGSIGVATSFDNGVTTYSRFVINKPDLQFEAPGSMTLREPGIWQAYRTTIADSVVVVEDSLLVALERIYQDYAPGSPFMPGRGFLRFGVQCASTFAKVSESINFDNLDQLTGMITRLVAAGNRQPEQAVYFPDSGGIAPTLYIGLNDNAGVVTFDGTTIPLSRTLHHEPDHGATYDLFNIQGGDSTHGLPDGFTITGACCFGSTFLVAGKQTDELGGVYRLTLGLLFEPASPVNYGVNDMFMLDETQQVFLATSHGCYMGGGGNGNLRQWARLGDYSGPCSSVTAASTLSGTEVHMIVRNENTGANGLYGCMVGITGAASPLFGGQEDMGHDGWSHSPSTDIVSAACVRDATYHVGVYYVPANDPTRVWVHTDTPGQANHPIGGGTYTITKLVAAGGSVFVLTSGGAAGLYQITPDTLSAGTLDAVTVPVGTGQLVGSVSNVVAAPGGGFFLCTDGGLYGLGLGGSPDGLLGKGLANTRIDFAAAGLAVGTGGHQAAPGTLYAANGTAIYDSNSYGNSFRAIVWRDILSQPVTVDLAVRATPASTAPGFVWTTNPYSRTGTNPSDGLDYFWLVKTGPPFSPTGAAFTDSAPAITAGGIRTGPEASQDLKDAVERVAVEYGVPVQQWTLNSHFTDAASPLHTLEPRGTVNFTYHRPACDPLPAVNERQTGRFVLSHRIACTGSTIAYTETVAAVNLCTQLLTAQEFLEAILYRIRKAGRRR